MLAQHGTPEEQEQVRSIEARLSRLQSRSPSSADDIAELSKEARGLALNALDRADILPLWYFQWFCV